MHEKLECVQDLLLSSQRMNGGNNDDDYSVLLLNESLIIESDNYSHTSNLESKKNLKDALNRASNLSGRVNKIVSRLDKLINEHNSYMVCAIEKIILSREILLNKPEKNLIQYF